VRISAIGHVLGLFLIVLAATMLVPIGWGVATGDAAPSLWWSLAITAAAGAALSAAFPRPTSEITRREGLMLVVLTWIAVSAFGGLPFYLSPWFPSFTDAFFESASGFTTTGSTVLADVEVLSPPVQFWRHFTHWLGGMGVVLLGVAVLPLVGHGGMQLYRAEFSGARSERLKPRLAETAAALWRIYLALTLICYLALRATGMSVFESLCHAFSTLGTGGFSTRTASIAAFDSVAVELVLVVFMLLAGISFLEHYRLWIEHRSRRVVGDVEVRAFVLIVAAATAVVAVPLVTVQGYDAAGAVRVGLFQVASIITTTGFVSDNFEVWPPLPQLTLLALMFVGGCTGSTAGGLKVARLLLLARVVHREFKRMVERRGVFAVRLGREVVAEPVIQSLLNLVYVAFVVNFASCLLLAAVGVDMLTAITAVAACMFNVGPGFGLVGAVEHYGHLPVLAKWVLAFDMIAGRLEFFTVLVILTPAFWRK
jgi:trk system potassium uptake protein TrkH